MVEFFTIFNLKTIFSMRYKSANNLPTRTPGRSIYRSKWPEKSIGPIHRRTISPHTGHSHHHGRFCPVPPPTINYTLQSQTYHFSAVLLAKSRYFCGTQIASSFFFQIWTTKTLNLRRISGHKSKNLNVSFWPNSPLTFQRWAVQTSATKTLDWFARLPSPSNVGLFLGRPRTPSITQFDKSCDTVRTPPRFFLPPRGLVFVSRKLAENHVDCVYLPPPTGKATWKSSSSRRAGPGVFRRRHVPNNRVDTQFRWQQLLLYDGLRVPFTAPKLLEEQFKCKTSPKKEEILHRKKKKIKGERKHESTQLAGSEPGLVKDFSWLVSPLGWEGGRATRLWGEGTLKIAHRLGIKRYYFRIDFFHRFAWLHTINEFPPSALVSTLRWPNFVL